MSAAIARRQQQNSQMRLGPACDTRSSSHNTVHTTAALTRAGSQSCTHRIGQKRKKASQRPSHTHRRSMRGATFICTRSCGPLARRIGSSIVLGRRGCQCAAIQQRAREGVLRVGEAALITGLHVAHSRPHPSLRSMVFARVEPHSLRAGKNLVRGRAPVHKSTHCCPNVGR